MARLRSSYPVIVIIIHNGDSKRASLLHLKTSSRPLSTRLLLLAADSQVATMAPLRVSILGTGLSLQAFHYPLITALPDKFVLHSIMERSARGKAQEVAGNDIKVVKTIEEVVNDPEVDVVSAHAKERRKNAGGGRRG